METKRLILAFALSFLVIFLYQYFFVKPTMPQPEEKPAPKALKETGSADEKEQQLDLSKFVTPQQESGQKEEFKEVAIDLQASQEEVIRVETDLYTALFTNRGAGLKSFILKKYRDDKKEPLDLVSDKVKQLKPLLLPFYFSIFSNDSFFGEINSQLFAVEQKEIINASGKSAKKVMFSYARSESNTLVKKSFTFHQSSYLIELELEVIRDGKVVKNIPLLIGPDLERNNSEERAMLMDISAATYNGQELKEYPFKKITTTSDTPSRQPLGAGYNWVAYHRNYFGLLVKSNTLDAQVNLWAIRHKEANKEVFFAFLEVNNPHLVFIGPKDERVLKEIENDFPQANEVILYGWFGSIAKLLLKVLVWIHFYVPNYGWAIIILTLLLKLVLFPLTYSSTRSMAKMQELQPKIKAIQKKYFGKKDIESRREMNAEIMALYKQEKVNPAGGCLPLLLQLPILWGFFRLLSVSINLRHEPWILWIQDLSQRDPIFLLPILMGASQLVLQKMTPSTGDDMQKKIMYIMPVLLVILFYNFPSGLNLYWFFSNLLQIAQQKLINDLTRKKRRIQQVQKKKKGRGE